MIYNYRIFQGPSLWDMLQALAGKEGFRPELKFRFVPEGKDSDESSFPVKCTSLHSMARNNSTGNDWTITGYFVDLVHRDPKPMRLKGRYSVDLRSGQLGPWPIARSK